MDDLSLEAIYLVLDEQRKDFHSVAVDRAISQPRGQHVVVFHFAERSRRY